MMERPVEYGGNRVTAASFANSNQIIFANGCYSYAFFNLGAGELLPSLGLESFTVYCIEKAPNTIATVVCAGQERLRLEVDDALQVEGHADCTVEVQAGTVQLLVAGTKICVAPSTTKLRKSAELKKVTKPWGHELWINGEHPGYAFKQIFIRAPHQTSLQFHNFKIETNLLVSGQARLHYKKDPAQDNFSVTPSDIATVDLNAVSVIDVAPPVLHRLEALTDILLYEVSTPHLDDVIRVADDSKRDHGRIEAEHRA